MNRCYSQGCQLKFQERNIMHPQSLNSKEQLHDMKTNNSRVCKDEHRLCMAPYQQLTCSPSYKHLGHLAPETKGMPLETGNSPYFQHPNIQLHL